MEIILTNSKSFESIETHEIITHGPIVTFLWKNEEGWPISFVSRNVEDQFGYSAEELTQEGVVYTDILHEDDIQKVKEETLKLSKENRKIIHLTPYRIITKDGDIKWVSEHSWLIRNSKGELTHFEGIIYDVTEQIETQQKLRESQEKYQLLFRSIRDAILVTDTERQIIDCNPAFEDLFGYSLDEIRGKKTVYIYGDDMDYRTLGDQLQARMDDHRFMVTSTYRKKSGELFQGETHVYFLKDDAGRTEGFIGFIRDISDQLRMEKRQEFLHSLLRHDLANMMTISYQSLEILDSNNLDTEAEQNIRNAEESLHKGIELIRKVNALLSVDTEAAEEREISLDVIISSIRTTLETMSANSSIAIRTDFPEKRPLVKAGLLVRQVFENLICNAFAHSKGSVIEVKVQLTQSTAKISVEDDGKGIENDLRDHLFERGAKGKDSDGMGLGLFLSKMITDAYGGRIEVGESDLGGARFDVFLKKK